MNNSVLESISMTGFVKAFKRIDDTMPDRQFAFILGAGASIRSGIKSAKDMVLDWVSILYEQAINTDRLSIDDWATATNLRISKYNPNDPAASYSSLYWRMFKDDPEQGYAYLESQMKGIEPSYGYSVLARILDNTRHKVIVTVNFDNLVADALSIFSNTYPLVCGHESLARFIRPHLRRPLVLKFHRDLLLSPKSEPSDLENPDPEFSNAIKSLLARYTPIIIGYGGNDNSLMKCLENIEQNTIPGGVYWCFRSSGQMPERRIQEFVSKQKGKLVPILGFDELFALLAEAFNFDIPDKFLLSRAQERANRIAVQVLDLNRAIKIDAEKKSYPEAKDVEISDRQAVSSALTSTLTSNSGEKKWWHWENEASEAKSDEEREHIYRQALAALPTSKELLNNFASFLDSEKINYEEADKCYSKAIELDPSSSIIMTNYGLFLYKKRKEFEKAEELFCKVLRADPTYVHGIVNYAVFLSDVKCEYNESEKLYQVALGYEPENITVIANYAMLLKNFRRDYDKAELLYKKAIELDSQHAHCLSDYANMLAFVRKKYDEAETLFKKALKIDPILARTLGNYGVFLYFIRKKPSEAEDYLNKSLLKEPKNSVTLANYCMMKFANGRIDEGLHNLELAFKEMGPVQASDLVLECNMYAYCFRRGDEQINAFRTIKKIIVEFNIISEFWDFSRIIEQAINNKHPESLWLPHLGEVLVGQRPHTILNDWDAWVDS